MILDLDINDFPELPKPENDHGFVNKNLGKYL